MHLLPVKKVTLDGCVPLHKLQSALKDPPSIFPHVSWQDSLSCCCTCNILCKVQFTLFIRKFNFVKKTTNLTSMTTTSIIKTLGQSLCVMCRWLYLNKLYKMLINSRTFHNLFFFFILAMNKNNSNNIIEADPFNCSISWYFFFLIFLGLYSRYPPSYSTLTLTNLPLITLPFSYPKYHKSQHYYSCKLKCRLNKWMYIHAINETISSNRKGNIVER